MIFIGLAGPSGAGKTTLANYLATYFGNEFEHIRLDDYLRDPAEFPRQGKFRNWEHPNNYKFDLLLSHLQKLREGREVLSRNFTWRPEELPYEFYLKPKKYILIEGALALADERLVSIFDRKIYLDVPVEVMLARRAKRMGKSFDPEYDREVVVPEFERHGMIQKIHADHIVDGTKDPNTVARTVRDLIAE
ncbi:MAG TPA: AAA family ATPase [Patescibacteria group bacterium]|nr:AAA family ATPase [Patescibacteria group bacterium]